MNIFTSKLFGKWAGVASASASLVVAVLAVTHPAVLSADAAVVIMGALGIHVMAADGVTPKSGGAK